MASCLRNWRDRLVESFLVCYNQLSSTTVNQEVLDMEKIITVPDEQIIINKALQNMRSKEPGIPAEKVKVFVAKVGDVISRNGKIDQAEVDELVRQLKVGEM